MTRYRVQYTEMIPGGARYRQDDMVHGDLEAVRTYFDQRAILAADSIVVIEQIASDGPGRIVPAGEWDVLGE